MKTELSKITHDLEQGTITENEARSLLLGLLNASVSFVKSGGVVDEIDEEIKRINECLDVSWKHLESEIKFKNEEGLKPFLVQIETYNNIINGLTVMRERALANER